MAFHTFFSKYEASDYFKVKTINEVYGSCGHALHNALYIALAISPLMLLLPREYAELARKDMLIKVSR